MISQQDSHDFTLAAAQIIPTLLIALFVIDRVIAPVSSDQRDVRYPTSRDVREKLHATKDATDAARASLVAALTKGSVISAEEMSSWERRWTSLEEARQGLVEAEESYDGIIKQREARDESGAIRYAALYRAYLGNLAYYMLFGIAGEISALFGVVRAIDYRTSVATTGSTIIFILTVLATHGWWRLFSTEGLPASKDRRLSKLYTIGTFAFPALGTIATIVLVYFSFNEPPSINPAPSAPSSVEVRPPSGPSTTAGVGGHPNSPPPVRNHPARP